MPLSVQKYAERYPLLKMLNSKSISLFRSNFDTSFSLLKHYFLNDIGSSDREKIEIRLFLKF